MTESARPRDAYKTERRNASRVCKVGPEERVVRDPDPQSDETRICSIIGDEATTRIYDLAIDQGMSARELTVESAALLDQLLAALLHAVGLKKIPGTFHGKIEEAFKQGLITTDVRDRLHAVDIRNAFGHDPDLRHFEHDAEVLQLCGNRSTGPEPAQMATPRWRFALSASHVARKLKDAIEERRNAAKGAGSA